MTDRAYESITKMISGDDIRVLMDAARHAETRDELWDAAAPNLGAPSEASRRTMWREFRRQFLDSETPAQEPAVLAWHVWSQTDVRRELLHIERCRHLRLLDELFSQVLMPALRTVGRTTLFGPSTAEISREDLEPYVSKRLCELSDSTRQITRNKLTILAGESGLVGRQGQGQGTVWRYGYYTPNWRIWLYGLYREMEDTGYRKRSESYVAERSQLCSRLLMDSKSVSSFLSQGERVGALAFEFFSGERFVRLVHSSTVALVRELGR